MIEIEKEEAGAARLPSERGGMNLSAFASVLESVLSSGRSTADQAEVIAQFVESDTVNLRLLQMAREVRDKIRDRAFVTDSQYNGRFVHLHDSDRPRRTLGLRSGFPVFAFYQASPERRIVIPLETMVVDRFRITGARAEHAYTSPNSALKLDFVQQLRIGRGEVLVRSDPLDFYQVEGGAHLRALVYVDLDQESSFQLAFERGNLGFIGTSMADVSAAKAIAFLELLEQFGSDFLGEAAHKWTGHPSSIVRWRALSAMNKVRHPATTQVLERFCDDEAVFVAESARAVLAKGMRN